MKFDIAALTILYSFSGAIITALYIPQVLAVVRAKSGLPDISILTWITWACCMTVSVLYSFYVVHDIKITLVSLFGSFFCFIIAGTTAYKRLKYEGCVGIKKRLSFFIKGESYDKNDWSIKSSQTS